MYSEQPSHPYVDFMIQTLLSNKHLGKLLRCAIEKLNIFMQRYQIFVIYKRSVYEGTKVPSYCAENRHSASKRNRR
jgi:hypothetical protein